MKKLLKIEWIRMTKARGFWVALVVGFIIAVLQYYSYGFQINDEYAALLTDKSIPVMTVPNSFYITWIGGQLNSMYCYLWITLLPVLSCLPYASSYFEDLNSNSIYTILTRVESEKYYIAKWIAVFFSGFIVVLLPLLMNILLNLTSTSLIPPVIETFTTEIIPPVTTIGQYLFVEKPLMYTIIVVIQLCLIGGAIATVGMVSCHIVSASYFTIMFPFFLWKSIDIIFQFINWNRYMPTDYFMPQNAMFHPAISSTYLVLLIGGSITVFYIRQKKRLDY